MFMEFKELSIGDRFFVNGNHYRKQSSRTAMMNGVIDIERPTGMWFYFSQRDVVKRLEVSQ